MSLLSLIFMAGVASAREYTVNLGVDWTDARATSGDIGARANARFGLGMRFSLGSGFAFETGTDYVFRRLDWSRADGADVTVQFDYIDLPARFVYRLHPVASVFLGPRLGIGALDSVDVPKPYPSFDPVAHAMIVLVEVGARIELPRGFAAEFFFERQLGDVAIDLREYQTLGLRGLFTF